jgi:hypothetical protein
LLHLKNRFPKSEIFVVYIPSVITSYRHSGTTGVAHIQVRGRPKRQISIAFMEKRSDEICNAINAATRRTGAKFVDVRPQIRMATRKKILHGPRDSSHFNKIGYEILATAVVEGIQEEKQTNLCKRISSN